MPQRPQYQIGVSQMSENFTKGVPLEELEMAYSGPAITTNKFVINVSQTGVRITFAETYSSDARALFRAAVNMAPADALSLRDVLNQVLEDLEQKSAQETNQPQSQNG